MIRLIYFVLFSSISLTFASNPKLDTLWENYKVRFNKTYSCPSEEKMRRRIWEENMELVQKHNSEENSKTYSFKIGINHLSDKVFEEYMVINGLKVNSTHKRNYRTPRRIVTVPRFVDWRRAGIVSKVKDQGNCGSCWAITSVESLEAQTAKKTGILSPLSAQNLLDCARGAGTNGCFGGNMDSAYRFIEANHGVDTEISYPYVGRVGYCHFRRSEVGATLRGWVDIKRNENALLVAVAAYGPIAAGVNAFCYGFKEYRSGVYEVEGCNPYTLNHAVLIVGYGTTPSGIDYWIIKNSWTRYWGENGYARIRRNRNNQIGIASLASFPLV